METIQLSSPLRSGQLSPESPQTIAFEDMGDSSVPLSPNRVQVGRSQEARLPLPLSLDSFSDPFLGSPIDFAQCATIPGSDAPLTLPVYTMLSGAACMMGQSSVPTVSGHLLDLNSGPMVWARWRILLERGCCHIFSLIADVHVDRTETNL